jgi:hypothetical protein
LNNLVLDFDDKRLKKGFEQLNLKIGNYKSIKSIKCEKNNYKIKIEEKNILIKYKTVNDFYRALGDVVANDFLECENKNFNEMGVMLDCSRNAVNNVSMLKKLLDKMALLGYNYLMLYMEDTLFNSKEKYLGYQRGSYTYKEIKEIEEYAEAYNIEIIPCIQGLAHYTAYFKTSRFDNIRDVKDILLCDSEETYTFLENIIENVSKTFKTRKINIGMDEAHLVGLGNYLRINGYKNRYETLFRHLEKIIEILKKYSLKPAMWSDMFFRLKYNTYYPEKIKKEEIIELKKYVPRNIKLIYWDYSHDNVTHYEKMMNAHNILDKDFIYAGGSWNWVGTIPFVENALINNKCSLTAAKNKGIQNVLLTSWGDDGNEASLKSIYPSMILYSNYNYKNTFSINALNKVLETHFNIDIETYKIIDLLNRPYDDKEKFKFVNPSKYLLYNDYLIGLFDKNVIEETYNKHYKELAIKINAKANNYKQHFNWLKVCALIAEIISLKADLGVLIKRGYDNKDNNLLKQCINKLTVIETLTKALKKYYYLMWKEENKTFGFEIIESRITTLTSRTNTTIKRLECFIENNALIIDELEEKRINFDINDRVDTFEQLYSNIFTTGLLGF